MPQFVSQYASFTQLWTANTKLIQFNINIKFVGFLIVVQHFWGYVNFYLAIFWYGSLFISSYNMSVWLLTPTFQNTIWFSTSPKGYKIPDGLKYLPENYTTSIHLPFLLNILVIFIKIQAIRILVFCLNCDKC